MPVHQANENLPVDAVEALREVNEGLQLIEHNSVSLSKKLLCSPHVKNGLILFENWKQYPLLSIILEFDVLVVAIQSLQTLSEAGDQDGLKDVDDFSAQLNLVKHVDVFFPILLLRFDCASRGSFLEYEVSFEFGAPELLQLV